MREGPGGAVNTAPLPPAVERSHLQGTIEAVYDELLSIVPRNGQAPIVETGPGAAGPDWQPDVKAELKVSSSDSARETPPYIRRTSDDRLLVTVAEPVMRNRHTVGIIQLTREAREVDSSLVGIRMSILGLFVIALVLTWCCLGISPSPSPARSYG